MSAHLPTTTGEWPSPADWKRLHVHLERSYRAMNRPYGNLPIWNFYDATGPTPEDIDSLNYRNSGAGDVLLARARKYQEERVMLEDEDKRWSNRCRRFMKFLGLS